MTNKPAILYKYCDWGNEFHRKLITQTEIFFASARRFNDPFDCAIPFRYDLLSDEEWRRLIRIHIKEDNPKWSIFQVDLMAEKIFAERNFEKPEEQEIHRKQQEEFSFEVNGAFCLSQGRDNILLWSHYANLHKGFCIGFDIIKLEGFLDRYFDGRNGLAAKLFRVQYEREYPILKPSSDINDIKIFEKKLTIKAKAWEYECEYRYILTSSEDHSASDYAMKIDREIIAEIILGCRISDSDRTCIISCIKNSGINAKIYGARMKQDSFGLDFEEVIL